MNNELKAFASAGFKSAGGQEAKEMYGAEFHIY